MAAFVAELGTRVRPKSNCTAATVTATFAAMAWRIEESVIRGEIDNLQRGRVFGRIWFVGLADPVVFDLMGNAWRDLAGRRLLFVNPSPKAGDLSKLAPMQKGLIGDCTASRRVKVPDIPLEEIGDYYAAGKTWPWHWANCLYFEWFGEDNGRMVIESADYRLTIAGETSWDMTAAEEETQRQANGEALQQFTQELSQGFDTTETEAFRETEDDDDTWDDEPALSETDADRLQEESDRLVDRIMARMDTEGDDADYEKILEEELEKRRRERGEAQPPSAEWEKEKAETIEEMNRRSEEGANEAESEEEVRRKHPLAERAFALSVDLLKDPELHGGMQADAPAEHPVVAMISSISIAGAKLAGALNGCNWPPLREECGLRLSGLKRARRHLQDALHAADLCQERKLADATWLVSVARETGQLLEETESIIADLRERLERGFD